MGCQKLTYYKSETAIGENWKFFASGIEKTASSSIFCKDYYAGGFPLPGRHTVQTSSDYDANGNRVYRYGYQGSEKDFEITNVTGAHITTYFREFDTRLNRTWSNDPAFQPWQSPYTSMDNNPISLNDPMGDCPTGDCDQYKAPNGNPVSIDKSATVYGSSDGSVSYFTPEGSEYSYFWDDGKQGFYNVSDEQYNEGSYADGFGSNFDTGPSNAPYIVNSFIDNPPEFIGNAVENMWSEVANVYENTAYYIGLSAYQKGRQDAAEFRGLVDGTIAAAPIGMIGSNFGMLNSVKWQSFTNAEGYLFSLKMSIRAPFDISVGRWGNVNSGVQHWGLNFGANKSIARTFSAILPEWNSLSKYTSGYIYKGAKFEFGITAPQGGSWLTPNIGLAPQFRVNGYKVRGKSTIGN